MQSTRYQGHNADGSSVQNHSCGSHYPYIVQRRDYILDSAPNHSRTHIEVLSPSGAVVAKYDCLADDAEGRLACWELAFREADELATIRRAFTRTAQHRGPVIHAAAAQLVAQDQVDWPAAFSKTPSRIVNDPVLGRVQVLSLNPL